jgi:hypothetical protein
MKLSDFIMLDETEKKSTVLQAGVLIAKRDESDCMVFLFHLGSYYVEAFCNPENMVIEKYVVFDDTKWLTPYLESMHLDICWE